VVQRQRGQYHRYLPDRLKRRRDTTPSTHPFPDAAPFSPIPGISPHPIRIEENQAHAPTGRRVFSNRAALMERIVRPSREASLILACVTRCGPQFPGSRSLKQSMRYVPSVRSAAERLRTTRMRSGSDRAWKSPESMTVSKARPSRYSSSTPAARNSAWICRSSAFVRAFSIAAAESTPRTACRVRQDTENFLPFHRPHPAHRPGSLPPPPAGQSPPVACRSPRAGCPHRPNRRNPSNHLPLRGCDRLPQSGPPAGSPSNRSSAGDGSVPSSARAAEMWSVIRSVRPVASAYSSARKVT
jgi:hypothetical protein